VRCFILIACLSIILQYRQCLAIVLMACTRCLCVAVSQVNEGEVIAVGPGRVTEAGAIVAVNVAIGDKVSLC
jgi:Chaperonin 10 Kd subunit